MASVDLSPIVFDLKLSFFLDGIVKSRFDDRKDLCLWGVEKCLVDCSVRKKSH